MNKSSGDQQVESERRAFEEFKKEELRKLSTERKVFEEYQSNQRTAMDRRDKETISTLRSELDDLKETLKNKEARWLSSLARLKNRSELLLSENEELKVETIYVVGYIEISIYAG